MGNLKLTEALTKRLCAEEDVIKDISDQFIKRSFKAKKHLLNSGEKWNKIWFINKGFIRLFYTDKDGKEFNKGFFCEDSFLWPVAPIARSNQSFFTIAALEDIEIEVCDFNIFFKILTKLNLWDKFAVKDLEKLFEEKFIREYEFLTLSAKDRYNSFIKNQDEIASRIPDYHIASYLGITNVSLSRIKKRQALM